MTLLVHLSGPAIETTEKDTEKGHQHGLGRRTRPDPNGLIPLSATCRLRGTAGEGDGWRGGRLARGTAGNPCRMALTAQRGREPFGPIR